VALSSASSSKVEEPRKRPIFGADPARKSSGIRGNARIAPDAVSFKVRPVAFGDVAFQVSAGGPNMPIDWATVNWGYVALLSGFAFMAGLIGSLLSFRNYLAAAVLTAVLFGIIFIGWTYYLVPQGIIPPGFVPTIKAT
jgi:hypothetical protein